jgi:hypothetical protein
MKKILFFSLMLLTLTVAASAQIGAKNRCANRRGIATRLTPVEKHDLRKDVLRQRTAQRMAKRDGVVTPVERIRIHRLKAETRRDAFRYTHNRRNRI